MTFTRVSICFTVEDPPPSLANEEDPPSLSNKKFDSAYEAGKEMQRLYEMTITFDEQDEPYLDDTQDIDMRDMFTTLRIP